MTRTVSGARVGAASRTAVTLPRRSISNLIYNPDFEYAPSFTAPTTTNSRFVDGTAAGSTTNDAYGWQMVSGAGSYKAQFDSTVFFNGATSYKLSTTATGSDVRTINANFIGTKANLAIVGGTSYAMTYYMKTLANSGSATSGASIAVQCLTAAGGVTGTLFQGTFVSSTVDWTQYTISFTAPANAANAQIRMRVNGSDGSATLVMDAWFDSLVLTPSPEITRPIA